jgi:hypothetical protein
VDVAGVLNAIETLVGAAAWVQLTTPASHGDDHVRRAYQHMRHLVMEHGTDPASQLAPVRAALFGEDSRMADRRRAYPSRGWWTVSVEASNADWLRREMVSYDSGAYETLFGWAEITRLERQSPLKVELGILAGTGVGVAAVWVRSIGTCSVYLSRAWRY